MIFNVEKRCIQELITNVEKGNMHLLLGAGFSANAKDSVGKDILLGEQLADELIKYCNLQITRKRTLGQIYDAACAVKGKLVINDFLKHKYFNSRSSWHKILPSFVWKRIYTLNIDDVLHDAVKKCQKPLQDYHYYIFKDKWSSNPFFNDDLQVIHLHGSVRKANQGFIFGAKEYAVAVKENLSWHVSFADDFSDGNFIIIGSQMQEPDLEVYLEYRSKLNSGKKYGNFNSFYVSPDIDDVLRGIFEKNGILCIEATAEVFFSWLDEKIPDRKKRSDILYENLPKIYSHKSDISRIAVIKFRNQFKQIIPGTKHPKPDVELHDFYFGDTPDWWDIQENNDASLTVVDQIKGKLLTEKNRLHVLLGTAGCGKSTAIKRIATIFANLQWQVYYFGRYTKFS